MLDRTRAMTFLAISLCTQGAVPVATVAPLLKNIQKYTRDPAKVLVRVGILVAVLSFMKEAAIA